MLHREGNTKIAHGLVFIKVNFRTFFKRKKGRFGDTQMLVVKLRFSVKKKETGQLNQ